jgi:hypothetical protein
MTTEARPLEAGLAWLRVGGIALVGWFAFLPFAMLFEPTWDAMIVGPPQRAIAALEGSDTRIMEIGSTYVVVRGTQGGYVRALYANGAGLVLPARAAGCIDLRSPLVRSRP